MAKRGCKEEEEDEDLERRKETEERTRSGRNER